MPELCHVSEEGPFSAMTPRASPGSDVPVVWAVDEEHLPHYLLPRDCPRVCWATGDAAGPLLGSPARRVVAVESR